MQNFILPYWTARFFLQEPLEICQTLFCRPVRPNKETPAEHKSIQTGSWPCDFLFLLDQRICCDKIRAFCRSKSQRISKKAQNFL